LISSLWKAREFMTLLNSTIGKPLLKKREIGKGIEPHPTNEYHLSILSYLLVI
jgi:hypothetical protein